MKPACICLLCSLFQAESDIINLLHEREKIVDAGM